MAGTSRYLPHLPANLVSLKDCVQCYLPSGYGGKKYFPPLSRRIPNSYSYRTSVLCCDNLYCVYCNPILQQILTTAWKNHAVHTTMPLFDLSPSSWNNVL